VVIGVLLGSSW